MGEELRQENISGYTLLAENEFSWHPPASRLPPFPLDPMMPSAPKNSKDTKQEAEENIQIWQRKHQFLHHRRDSLI